MSFKIDTEGSTQEELIVIDTTPDKPLPTKREDIVNPFKGQFELAKVQEDIILAIPDNDVIIIDSISGSAKTTTQVAMAHNNPAKSLYLTFSKALAVEAAGMFPSHVECRTIHSLAYREYGTLIAHKLNRPRGAYKNVAGTGTEIAKFYKIPAINLDKDCTIKASLIGLLVKDTLAKFEASALDKVDKSCIPAGVVRTKLKRVNPTKLNAVKKALHTSVLKYAKKLWIDRQNENSVVLATHDTYLKMWAMTNPIINTKVLYVDEIQDAAMVFLAIIKAQVGLCQVVVVGDPDQALYEWRHSVNGLAMMEGTMLKLNQSFRYGQDAADLAMIILDNGRDMVGSPDMDTKVGFSDIVDKELPYVKLFRTNAVLLQEALEFIEQGMKVNIHVDVKNYVSMLQSAEALYYGNMKKVKHEDIVPFDTWAELKEEAKTAGVISRIYKVIASGDVRTVIDLLISHKNTRTPDITLMSAHKSKGQTFDYVVLADDFISCYDKKGWIGLPEAERRLLYVASTRARLGTEYNNTVLELVERKHSEM